MKYIDLHCDTLMQAFIQGKQDLSALNGTMLTLDKLKARRRLRPVFCHLHAAALLSHPISSTAG